MSTTVASLSRAELRGRPSGLALVPVPLLVALVPALALARLLPDEGVGLAVRLALATACLFLPGILLARVLRLSGLAPAVALGLAVITAALIVVFVVEGPLLLAGAVIAATGVATLPFAFRTHAPVGIPGLWVVLAVGALFGAALWFVAPPLDGDALFHLARVRKLEAFDALSLDTVNEFRDGGLHPGYAFPLWQGFLALVAVTAGVDPSAVVLYESSILVPLAFVVAYEAGYALFRTVGAGIAVLAAQVGLIALAPGHGGAYTALALPATTGRQLLVPVVLALVFAYVADRRWQWLPAIGAGTLALALVHPTYAIYLLLPLGGFLVARVLLARSEGVSIAVASACVALPTAGVVLWLRPIVEDTVSFTPSAVELERALRRYAGEIDLIGGSYRLAPELLTRGGAVAVAGLLVLPFAALIAHRRGAAFALGGSLAVLAVLMTPQLFEALSDATSLSQARRLAGFVPFAFAFAAGLLALSGLLRLLLPPVALAAGVGLQFLSPGHFEAGVTEDELATVVWIGGLAAAGALVVATFAGLLVRRRLTERPVLAGIAAVLFVLPVAVTSANDWTVSGEGAQQLPPGLVAAVRTLVPEQAVVYADLETSYRIAAAAPVYVANGPPAHVADTKKNDPYGRRQEMFRYYLGGADSSIPKRFGARWVIVDSARYAPNLELTPVYDDGRYALYRL